MNIWWCEEHGERGYVAEVRGVSDPHCWVRDMGPIPCRMVELQLVPLDARIVGTDAIVIETDLYELVGDLNQLDNGPGPIRAIDIPVLRRLVVLLREAVDVRALAVSEPSEAG